MNSKPGKSREPEMPRLDSWTQGFADAALERAFRRAVSRDMARGVRVGLLLAILLFAIFGVFDVLLGVEALAFTFTVRAAIISVAVLLLVTWSTPFHREHRESLLFVFCLLATAAIAAIVAVVEPAVVDRYYVGFILVVMAGYLMLGIRFLGGTVIALLNIATYLAVEIVFHRVPDVGVLTNLMLLVSVAAIAAIGAYSLGQQRRMAFLRRIQLERAAESSQRIALHDVLTGLPNRRLFMEKLSQAMARDTRFEKHAAVLFLDLDDFKNVNDRYGHAAGDQVLQVVAERLSDCVRETDTVARFGGDEFVVLLEDLASPADVDIALARINETLPVPIVYNGDRLNVSASIGMALHPRDGDTPEALLQAADEAMYRVKTPRRGDNG
ncbi:MAG TPA: GGDEF domain-containing protein [Gammaproteobacteria bacterium]